MAHMQAAKRLSQACYGADEVVMQWVLGNQITQVQADAVESRYRERYGQGPAQYYRDTLDLWRHGERGMSGLVRIRLITIAPEAMPLGHKIEMVKKLAMAASDDAGTTATTMKVTGSATRANCRHIMERLKISLKSKQERIRVPRRYEPILRWLADERLDVYERLKQELEQAETDDALDRCQRTLLEAVALGAGTEVNYTTMLPSYGLRVEINLQPVRRETQVEGKQPAGPEPVQAKKEWYEHGWLWVGVGIVGLLLLAA